MAAWWDEDHKLLLITQEEFAALPDGEVLTCTDGSTAIKGQDEIDDDTRGGNLAYGVTGDHPLRLERLELAAQRAADKVRNPDPKPELPEHTVWTCKVGVVLPKSALNLPAGADHPMRCAVEKAFLDLTGHEATFNFSGWGDQLTPSEFEVAQPRHEAA